MIESTMTTTRNSVPQRGGRSGTCGPRSTVERIAGLEGVDRHVLGAVVLEDAADVRRATDQREVAEEDRRPGRAPRRGAGSRPFSTFAVVTRGDEQRQQEEDPDAGDERDEEHQRRSSPCRARRRPPRPGRSRCGRASGCRRRASRTGRRGRGRTALATSACRGTRSRAARWRRRCGRRDGGGRRRSRRGRASGRPRSGPGRRRCSVAWRAV